MVFEGFMDFLSLLSYRKNANPEASVLILNSTNLWRHALPHIENPPFEEIALFLDNGSAGDTVTGNFQNSETTAKITDMRKHYTDHDDLNVDLSRNCTAPLTWYFAPKEKRYGITTTHPRVPRRGCAHSPYKRFTSKADRV